MTESSTTSVTKSFLALLEIVAKLRNPQGGCPWDLEQTHETLTPYVIEEAYEVVDAVKNDRSKLAEELGDLLLQVVLHAQIASEEKTFDMTQIVELISKKLVHRHPHVFGDTKVQGTKEVLENWERLKASEKPADNAGKKKSHLDGVPKSMPALLRAQRIGEKASRVGFDWVTSEAVLDKVREEFEEFMQSLSQGEDAQEEELGDLLFALTQWARKKGKSAEEILNRANEKFTKRFMFIESNAGSPLHQLSAEQLETLWQQAKQELKA